MGRGKRRQRSQIELAQVRIRQARTRLEEVEVAAEVELRSQIAALRAGGLFVPALLEDYAAEAAFEVADRSSDELLEEVNLILDVEFDPSPVDSELLAEDPDGAFMDQIQMGLQDHLEAHLLELIAANPGSFAPTGAVDPRPRRLSGLARNDERIGND